VARVIGFQMANKLKDVCVDEISLVNKGANKKRIYMRKSADTETEPNDMDTPEQIAKAAQEALVKAEAAKKEAEDKLAALEKAQKEAEAKAADEKAALEKAKKDAEDKAAELEKVAAAEKEAKEVAESIQKASSTFKNIPEKAEDLGPLLRKIRKADAKVADQLEALLTKVDALVKQSLDAKGSSKALDAPATALDEITKRAKALLEAGKVTSLAKGFDQVLKDDADLYSRYEAEKQRK
jgi:chromosome segregation ATPase